MDYTPSAASDQGGITVGLLWGMLALLVTVLLIGLWIQYALTKLAVRNGTLEAHDKINGTRFAPANAPGQWGEQPYVVNGTDVQKDALPSIGTTPAVQAPAEPASGDESGT